MLGLILDVGVLFFIFYMFKNCSKNSKLQNAVESIGYILSSIISIGVSVAVSDFCYTNFFRVAIVEKVSEVVRSSNEVDASVDKVERIMNYMPTMVNNGAKIYKTTTGESLAQLNRCLAGDLTSASGEVVDILARPVIDGLLRALFFFVTFVGCYFLMKAFYPTVEAYLYTPDRAAVTPVVCMVLGSGKVMIILLSVICMIELIGPVFPDFYIFRPSSYNWSLIFKFFCKDNLMMVFLGDGIFPIFS